MEALTDRLLASEEPSIRLRTLLELLGAPEDSAEVRRARDEVRASPRVTRLLEGRTTGSPLAWHPYQKWCGEHWTLAVLAEIAYPPGDESLRPLAERVLGWLCSEEHVGGVRVIEGRARRCASQEGYAVWCLVRLGLGDDRIAELVANLLRWQWPDGGWNCDGRPEASNSSFHETTLPLRALSLVASRDGCPDCAAGARRAAEVLLRRGLFRRVRDGEIMNPAFLKPAWPAYWRYDLLAGLTALAEGGFLDDRRCAEALDVLESKRLATGCWQAEARHYKVLEPGARMYTNMSRVDWGPVGRRQANEWVTVSALSVLRRAGRWGP